MIDTGLSEFCVVLHSILKNFFDFGMDHGDPIDPSDPMLGPDYV